jgi:hypothetical protein
VIYCRVTADFGSFVGSVSNKPQFEPGYSEESKVSFVPLLIQLDKSLWTKGIVPLPKKYEIDIDFGGPGQESECYTLRDVIVVQCNDEGLLKVTFEDIGWPL